MASFVIREGKETDLPGIAQLAAEDETSAGDRNPDVFARCWRWLYLENPTQAGHTLVGVTPEERVVGHYGLVPFSFRRNGEPLGTGGFLCQLRVAESMRNQFLFPQLEMRMLREYAPRGIDFTYGLINRPAVLKAHLYFKFKPVFALSVLARPVRLRNVLSEAVKNKALRTIMRPFAPLGDVALGLLRRPGGRGVRVERIEQFAAEMAADLTRLTRQFPIAAARTVETLNWRFATLKDREYRIHAATKNGALAGYIVTRKMPMKQLTSLAVVDVLFAANDHGVANALINAALREAKRKSVDVVACLLSADGPYYRAFKRNLFLRTPESFTLILHEPPDAKHRLSDAPPADWHLTWFDHDFV